jgi:hypothetical protein
VSAACVPIICHRCQQHGVANLPPASLTPAPVSLTPVANLPPVSIAQGELVAKFAAGVIVTGGKFAAGVVDTTGVIDTGGAP